MQSIRGILIMSDNITHSLNPMGTVIDLHGVVAIVGSKGYKRILKLGDMLNEGDTVVTGDEGDMTIGLADGTTITVGHDSEVTLNTFLS